MRSKRVIRYYCDFCNRGKFRKPDMEKHERGCTANPNRVCGLCERVGNATTSLPDMISAIESGGLEQLETLVDSCPACILAGVRAWNKLDTTTDDEMIFFNYKEAADKWWKAQSEMVGGY